MVKIKIIELKNEYQENLEQISYLECELANLIVKNDKIKKILVKLGEMSDSDDSDSDSDSNDSDSDSADTIEQVELD